MTFHGQRQVMRGYALALVALFLTSITVPLATAQEFEEPQTEPVFETYSGAVQRAFFQVEACLLYTSPSPRDLSTSRMPSSA